jgi:hypothetical protein
MGGCGVFPNSTLGESVPANSAKKTGFDRRFFESQRISASFAEGRKTNVISIERNKNADKKTYSCQRPKRVPTLLFLNCHHILVCR